MSTLFDARAQFARRRAANEFSGGALSMEEICSVIGESTQQLFNEIGVVAPYASQYLIDESHDLSVCLDSDVDSSEQAPILESSRVFAQSDGSNVLRITSGLLEVIAAQLSPYFDQSEIGKNHTTMQGVILATAARLSISSWVFDRLDPRREGEAEEKSIRSIGLEVGLAGLLNDEEGEIDAVMDVLRYRFIGRMGFADLMKDPDLEIIQKVFRAYFDQEDIPQAIADNDIAYSLKFAFAHMLSKSEADRLIRMFAHINKVVEKYRVN